METSEDKETITLYEAIGADDTVRKLVRRFYELMETLPEAQNARAIHPPSLQNAETKLYEYLTGYLGGPPLFVEKYGHPRLRARHLHAPITKREVDEWLLCFRGALDDTVEHPKLREIIWEPIERLAYHMQNKEDAHEG
ncbi:group II truncated hemoglobin [Rhizobium sp. L1K21]|uniref:group II truncated hemoglobin n=1 Tax=Rhizobium sp. L1K21 TaxID=2954933 RepID=UPI0020928C69|nr:group II truncated hemoglobin [Rhizobium sp. L1K21]